MTEEEESVQVEENEEDLEEFIIKEKNKASSLREWQHRAITYFFGNDRKAIYEVCTGCITGDSLIDTPRDLIKYPKGIPIKELVGKVIEFDY